MKSPLPNTLGPIFIFFVGYKNLNEIIPTTLEVCKHQWRKVAKVKTTFNKTLGKVSCYSSELGQVFLNTLANTAYAIEEKL